MAHPALDGLLGRNRNLNSAYKPTWDESGLAPFVEAQQASAPSQGNTNFDPFQGTGWGSWLDKVEQNAPGGISNPRKRGNPMAGLRSAAPAPVQAGTIDPSTGVRMPAVNNPFATKQFLAG